MSAPEFEALAARYVAGEIPALDLVRGRRQLLGASYAHAASGMRLQGERSRRHGNRVRVWLAEGRRYSDERLTSDLASDLAGPRREARLLLQLPTPAERREAVRLALRFYNASPSAGRWSDALRSVLADARISA